MKNILYDSYRRKIDYLRLSVTDRCDMKCDYCRVDGAMDYSEPDDWLRFDEIERIVKAFVALGVKHVRLTGGEPLLRKNIDQLAARLASLDGLDDLSLSTNCSRMQQMAGRLFKAGVNRLNVSLDTLDPHLFNKITQGNLKHVLKGIDSAKQAGFDPIRINTVVMRDINDLEIERILEYCAEREFTLRLIETMPMGYSRGDGQDRYISLQTIKQRLEKHYQLISVLLPGGGPAKYYQLENTNTKIGFITPLSQHFCETCNRLRLTTDGILHLCLGQEHQYSLRDIMRNGVSDDELQQHILQAVSLKPERHEFNSKPWTIMRSMTRTGG